MFQFHKPTAIEISRFLASQQAQAFSYREVGATRTMPPAAYTLDHNRVQLGRGEDCFARAVEALRRWQMFDLGWVSIYPRDAPIAVGTTVAIVAQHFGFWSLNACRTVYVLDEDGAVRRYGFAYGTLPAHAERGEERFTVECQRDDDAVWYDILAFSRPRLLAALGFPFARHLQQRFARDSKRAMRRAVQFTASLA